MATAMLGSLAIGRTGCHAAPALSPAPADVSCRLPGHRRHRVATFGIGDITSVTGLADGRRFFALGDTAYYNLNANGSAGKFVGFGNNSAWVQSGSCFTLLDRDGPGPRSWVLPPQRDGSVYWPGASVVVGPRLYVFMLRLVSTSRSAPGAARRWPCSTSRR